MRQSFIKINLKSAAKGLQRLGRALNVSRNPDLSLDRALVVEGQGRSVLLRAWKNPDVCAEVITEGSGKGAVAVPGSQFKKFINQAAKTVEEAKIEISIGEAKATVSAGFSSTAYRVETDPDQPRFKVPYSAPAARIRAETLSEMLEATADFMAPNDARYYLEGLLLELAPASGRAIATDGHCLAVYDMKLDGFTLPDHPFKLILSRAAVLLLKAAAKKEKADAVIRAYGGRVAVEIGKQTIYARQYGSSKYPDYRRLIKDFDAAPAIETSRDNLISLVDQAESLGADTLELNPDRGRGIVIATASDEAENSDIAMRAEAGKIIPGSPATWAAKNGEETTADAFHANPEYIRRAAVRLDGDKALIGISNSGAPAVFTAPGLKMLIMGKRP